MYMEKIDKTFQNFLGLLVGTFPATGVEDMKPEGFSGRGHSYFHMESTGYILPK